MPPLNTGSAPGAARGAAPSPAAPAQAASGSNLSPISHDDWQRLSLSQKQQQFSGHFKEVTDHLNSIIQYADQAVQFASGALNKATSDAGPHPTPDQKKVIVSAERLLKSRQAMQKRLMDYSHNKAAPGMLDVFYLNQTRQHLGEIVKVLQDCNVPDADKTPVLEELSSRLDVCREGTALNIMECASQLHLKSQPNKFHAAYQQAREELINTHLLSAVRASHAKNWTADEKEEVRLGKRFEGSLSKYKENKSETFKSVEIHEVQSLRNALSKELGLPYLADRHISLNYEKQVGDIAKKHIPKLITKHAVGLLLAEKILARAEQLIGADQRVDTSDSLGGKRLKTTIDLTTQDALNTTLKQEFGDEVGSIFEYDDASASVVLRSADELAQEWASSTTTLPQEATTGVVKREDVEKTIDAFFQADKLVHHTSPNINQMQYFNAVQTTFARQHASIQGRTPEDEEKKRQLARLAQITQDSVQRAQVPISPDASISQDSPTP